MEASVICHTRQSQSGMRSEARYGYDFQRIKNFRVAGFFIFFIGSLFCYPAAVEWIAGVLD